MKINELPALPPPPSQKLSSNNSKNGIAEPLPSFDPSTHPLNAGYTLVRGQIKLMAMLPNHSDNQGSSGKGCNALPPITPRMMPSIAQTYGRPYPPSPLMENNLAQASASTTYFRNPYAYAPAAPFMYPTSYPQHQPTFESAISGYPNPAFPHYPQQQFPQQNYQPYGQPNPNMMMGWPQTGMSYHQEYNPYAFQTPVLDPRLSQQYFPQQQQAQQMFPQAVQSSPYFLAQQQQQAQAYGMYPVMQHPHQRTVKKQSTRKSKRKGVAEEKEKEDDVFIVVEEEDITSSSSSLSSTEEYEIRRRGYPTPTPAVSQQTLANDPPTVKPEEAGLSEIPPPTGNQEIDTGFIKIYETDPQKDNRGNNKKPGKKAPEIVPVHDCFLSDSSEADLTADPLASDADRKPKRKGLTSKSQKMSGIANSGQVFEDLDKDLSPDEMRTYTCEYLVELLSSQDWNNCYIALQIVVRMARHRPQTLLHYLNDNGLILWCTFGHITSAKSALCRAAIVTFKELFQRIPDSLDNHLDKVTEKLLVKSLAPNKFIRVECDKALTAMVKHCNLVKVLGALETVKKRPHSRAVGLKMALATIALQVVHTAGIDLCLMNASYAEKLLPMLFSFMTEPNSGIRTLAKEALSLMMNHLQFETVVMRHVKFDRNSTEVFKKLDKMRGRCCKARNYVGGHH